MTTPVPADIIALLPRYVDSDDFPGDSDECTLSHEVTWDDTLVGVCVDCGHRFDPDDVPLTDAARERVEEASWIAGLIKAVTS